MTYQRTTHAYDGELAVFLIGVRIHQPWRLDIVAPVIAAMPRMIRELEIEAARGGDSGYLGQRTLVGAAGPTTIQWWRSAEDIYRYAGDRDRQHRPAWAAFNKAAMKSPDVVTIWHETYAVSAAESLYGGPRPFGLGAIAGVVPAGRRGEAARERLAAGAPIR